MWLLLSEIVRSWKYGHCLTSSLLYSKAHSTILAYRGYSININWVSKCLLLSVKWIYARLIFNTVKRCHASAVLGRRWDLLSYRMLELEVLSQSTQDQQHSSKQLKKIIIPTQILYILGDKINRGKKCSPEDTASVLWEFRRGRGQLECIN